jgi:hypothetical protein
MSISLSWKWFRHIPFEARRLGLYGMKFSRPRSIFGEEMPEKSCDNGTKSALPDTFQFSNFPETRPGGIFMSFAKT